MTQKLSAGIHPAVTYYRKQSQPHVSHAESGAFTTAAQNQYSLDYNVPVTDIELGRYRSGQGIPTAGLTEEI